MASYEDNISSEVNTDDNSDVDKAEFGLYQCLPVDDAAPNFESAEPLTVEEYLRRVRYEASKLPDVKRSYANIEQNAASLLGHGVLGSDVATCDPDRKPSIVWVRSFLSQYVSLRKFLESIRLKGHLASQYGISEFDLPGIEALFPLGQVELQAMLEDEVGIMQQIDQIEKETFTKLYIILSLIELPCHPDILATIRNLVRCCASMRASEPCPGNEQLSMLNLLMTICGGLYKQDEELATMWDEEMFSLA